MEERLRQIAEENQKVLRHSYARERNAFVALLVAGVIFLACLLVSAAYAPTRGRIASPPEIVIKSVPGALPQALAQPKQGSSLSFFGVR